MGDRANVVIREGKQEVWLYTHWGGASLAGVVRAALAHGKSRWTDAPYLARIIFNAMTTGNEADTTGFGIWSGPCDNEHDWLVVDVGDQEVKVYDFTYDSRIDWKKQARGPHPIQRIPFQQFVDGAKTIEEVETMAERARVKA